MIVFRELSLIDKIIVFLCGLFWTFKQDYDQMYNRYQYINALRLRDHLQTGIIPVPYILTDSACFIFKDENVDLFKIYLWFDTKKEGRWNLSFRDCSDMKMLVDWGCSPKMQKIVDEIHDMLKERLSVYYPGIIDTEGNYNMEFIKHVNNNLEMYLKYEADFIPMSYPPDEEWSGQIRTAIAIKDAVEEMDSMVFV